MNETNFTLAPWAACDYGDYGDYDGNCIVILGDDARLAVVLGSDNAETKANARLIAAAPELCAACSALAGVMQSDPMIGYAQDSPYDKAVKMVTAALKKVRGEE